MTDALLEEMRRRPWLNVLDTHCENGAVLLAVQVLEPFSFFTWMDEARQLTPDLVVFLLPTNFIGFGITFKYADETKQAQCLDALAAALNAVPI